MNSIIPFGKYKGRELEQLVTTDRAYVQWMADNMLNEWGTKAKQLLGLPIATTPTQLPKIELPSTTKLTVSLDKKDMVCLVFKYNISIVARLKSAVDGAKWDAKKTCWFFPTVKLPEFVNEFGLKNIQGDTKTFEAYQNELDHRKALEETRQKTDTKINIKNLLIELRDYQRVAVEFAVRAKGKFLLADEPGVGKTFSAIAFATHTESKTLIVCPKSVKENWKRQIKKATGKVATVWSSEGCEDTCVVGNIENWDEISTLLSTKSIKKLK